MIIIEGPDGAGKTTLAADLSKADVVDMSLCSPKRAYPEKTLTESTKDYIRKYAHRQRVCIDRLIFSELVYGPIMRQKCEFDSLTAFGMIADIIDSGSIVIFCLPDVNSLIFKNDEDSKTIENIRHIHSQYSEWALKIRQISRMQGRIIRYQWNLSMALETLISTLRRFQ